MWLALPLAPQLRVEPRTIAVGDEVVVYSHRAGQPIASIEVTLELPDGLLRTCGSTAADGSLRVRLQEPGFQVFSATIDDVRHLCPVSVARARRAWLLAVGSVPLGLAFLWHHLSRARGRRAP
jgi:hypothetical protein